MTFSPDFLPPSFFGGTPRQNGETLSYGPFVRDDVAAAFRLLAWLDVTNPGFLALTFGKFREWFIRFGDSL